MVLISENFFYNQSQKKLVSWDLPAIYPYLLYLPHSLAVIKFMVHLFVFKNQGDMAHKMTTTKTLDLFCGKHTFPARFPYLFLVSSMWKRKAKDSLGSPVSFADTQPSGVTETNLLGSSGSSNFQLPILTGLCWYPGKGALVLCSCGQIYF